MASMVRPTTAESSSTVNREMTPRRVRRFSRSEAAEIEIGTSSAMSVTEILPSFCNRPMILRSIASTEGEFMATVTCWPEDPQDSVRRSGHTDGMLILIAGVVVGLAAVIPLGPMSMTIIGVATKQGRLAGAYAAGGVVAGDLASAGFAVALALAGTRLPTPLFTVLQLASVIVLVVVGLLLMTKTERMNGLAGDLKRPGTVLFTLTALSPITIGSWLAILMASPFVANPLQLGVFVSGITVASGIWHPTLAIGAASVGHRLGQNVLQWLARLGGVFMLGLAALMAVA